MNWLTLATYCNLAISILHILIVFVLSPQGYRTFGAGEQMADMAEQGKLYPHILTLVIAIVFLIFGLYTYYGSQSNTLPFIKWVLIIIASIYTLRGLAGFPMFIYGEYESGLMLWSSVISFSVGVFHFAGIKQFWSTLEKL